MINNIHFAYISLILTDSVIWGVASVVIKSTLQYIQPFTFLTYRFWISFIAILPFFIWHLRKKPHSFKEFKEIISLTIIGIPISLILVFLGIDRTSALESSFILATAPIFCILGGVIFLKEKITTRELVGIFIAWTGTVALIIEPLFGNRPLNFSNITGNVLLLLSNLTGAYYTVKSRSDLRHKFSPWLITIIGFIIAPFFLTPLTIIEQPLRQATTTITNLPLVAHLGVFYMAIMSGIVGYFFYQNGLKYISASKASLFQYLGPIVSTPLAVIWLKETITTPFIIGACIILIGVFVAEYKPRKQEYYIIKLFKNLLITKNYA